MSEQQAEGYNILNDPVHGIYIPTALFVGGCSLLIYMSGETRILYGLLIYFSYIAYKSAMAYNRKRSVWPDKWSALELEEQTLISKNSAIYRFTMKTSFESLNFPAGSHLAVKVPIDGENVIRYYTPITSNVETGHFDIIVKSYADGVVSKYFASLKPGQLVEFQGPVGKLNYAPNSSKEIGIVAGGSGITPVLQVLNEVITVPEDLTKVHVIYANETENDILLKEELDDMSSKYPNFMIHYVLKKPSDRWNGDVGYVTKDLMNKYLPGPSDDTRLFICGPEPMVKSVLDFSSELGWSKGSLESEGDDQVFVF